MKRIICLLVCAVLLCVPLVSCGNGDTEETTFAEKLPDHAGSISKDYDENGNFILTSTDDRVVYSYNSGYVVFTFAGNSVSKIQRVFAFEDAKKAQEYSSAQAKQAVEAGNVPPQMIVNGSNVIYTVGFSTDNNDLGVYYAKSKTDVLAAFAGEESR